MLSIAAAVVLAVHGAIHLIGFVVPWQLASVEGFPYRTTQLAGLVDVGAVGARAVGVIWLALAFGFIVASWVVWREEPWAVDLVVAVALGSLIVCVLGLPESAAGVFVNLAILTIAAYLVLTGQTQTGIP